MRRWHPARRRSRSPPADPDAPHTAGWQASCARRLPQRRPQREQPAPVAVRAKDEIAIDGEVGESRYEHGADRNPIAAREVRQSETLSDDIRERRTDRGSDDADAREEDEADNDAQRGRNAGEHQR